MREFGVGLWAALGLVRSAGFLEDGKGAHAVTHRINPPTDCAEVCIATASGVADREDDALCDQIEGEGAAAPIH